ncbi:MAG: hypothetical protein A2V67_06950 [Deltaproteobacteria bacterium RBG_13_61_14]|nr:MAG: hypothetical protein A2V67_06950 [Deltaproteobacteria bacterium RBG_13_61_14]
MKISGAGSRPAILLKLQNPDKKVLITPGQIPLVKEVDGADPEVNVIMTLDAEMFHYLIWGKLTFAKALNEKVLLMDYTRTLPPQDQASAGPGMAGEPLQFNNILYEMFLIRIGAGRLITEKTFPEIPLPGERRPVQDIPLDPVPPGSLLGPMANALAFFLGGLGGLVLRPILPWLLKEDLEAPPVYSTVPDPRPPIPPASSGVRLKLMKFFFRKIDIFSALQNLAQGMLATGPFK